MGLSNVGLFLRSSSGRGVPTFELRRFFSSLFSLRMGFFCPMRMPTIFVGSLFHFRPTFFVDRVRRIRNTHRFRMLPVKLSFFHFRRGGCVQHRAIRRYNMAIILFQGLFRFFRFFVHHFPIYHTFNGEPIHL